MDKTALGMNAAYRYWDRIGWYPDYYACLDDQLIVTHHQRIHELWRERRIRQFFLHGSFFNLHPDCINADGMHSLDQVLPHWFNRRGKAQGWPDLTQDPAFRLSDTTKITTGAMATRFAAWMGHQTIYIAGVDLKYVEILPEAEHTSGVGLVMRETPKVNPNYFFDDYQQAGDTYNIPNPASHDHALHIRSFDLISQDFARNGQDTTIVNLNPDSLLEEHRTFPYWPAERVVAPPGLDCVAIPTNASEIPALLANFRFWAGAGFAPRIQKTRSGEARPVLLIVFNNGGAKPEEDRIHKAFAFHEMNRYFDRLEIRYLDLQGENDLYEKDYTKKVGPSGHKSGPNKQFFGTMRAAAEFGLYVFQMETDCVPLVPGWLDALDAEIRGVEPFWVLGSRYHGSETLSPLFADHLNGNAVYAAGDTGFQRFLVRFWEPWTTRLVAETDRRIAYDCVPNAVFSLHGEDDPEVSAAHRLALPMMRETALVLNLSGRRDLETLSANWSTALRKQYPRAVVLHNRRAQQQVTAAADKPRLLVIDMTATGNGTATGEVKAAVLSDWPGDRVLQLAAPGADRMALVRRKRDDWVETTATPAKARAAIEAFDPEMILYRPLADRPALHALAMETIRARPETPLVTWIMDDWPARAAAEDPEGFAPLEADLRWLLDRSGLRLSISDAMSKAFQARYGLNFVAQANAVDPALWAEPLDPGPIRVRYAGGMARDMNADSLLRVARAVERLRREGLDIVLEISTRDWWWQREQDRYAGLEGTTADTRVRDAEGYRRWLREADVLVLAYNFDPASLRYVRYSMANKMPECLASGAALLVHGPRGVATVDYLAATGAVEVADSDREGTVETSLRRLADPVHRTLLAGRAREIAFTRHDIAALRRDFANRLRVLQTGPEDSVGKKTTDTALVQARIEAIHRSFSWRVTAPLRMVKRRRAGLPRSDRPGDMSPEQYLAELESSHSLKLTAPLRRLSAGIRSVVGSGSSR